MQQSGALVFKDGPKGRRVLLVRKRRSQEWSIPKGRIEPELSFAANAAKEAYEEAGVKGEISNAAIGHFRAMKRGRNGSYIIEVWVYLLKATGRAREWPEKSKRDARWFRCERAARVVREPLLSELCLKLDRSFAAAGD